MHRRLFAAVLLAVLCLIAAHVAADESPDRLEDAKASLVQLASWFESLPPGERAAAARELRRWLAETYGSEAPFPFALPSEEEIAAWDSGPAPSGPAPSGPAQQRPAGETPTAPAAGAAPERAADVEPVAPTETRPLPKVPRAPGRCNTLTLFDTDGDGVLNGLDRYWRHLYLWLDSDGDRNPSDGEMVSPFEHKIREISLDLRYYLAGKGKKAGRGEIETDDYILVDTEADGIGTLFPARDDAALAVDADALRRDPQGLEIRETSGAEVTGVRPFVAGWTITDRNGVGVAIDCPD